MRSTLRSGRRPGVGPGAGRGGGRSTGVRRPCRGASGVRRPCCEDFRVRRPCCEGLRSECDCAGAGAPVRIGCMDYVIRAVRAGEWRLAKELRLAALQDPAAPVAFLETYEQALERSDD